MHFTICRILYLIKDYKNSVQDLYFSYIHHTIWNPKSCSLESISSFSKIQNGKFIKPIEKYDLWQNYKKNILGGISLSVYLCYLKKSFVITTFCYGCFKSALKICSRCYFYVVLIHSIFLYSYQQLKPIHRYWWVVWSFFLLIHCLVFMGRYLSYFKISCSLLLSSFFRHRWM